MNVAAGVKREQCTEDELKEMGAQLSTLRAERAVGARARKVSHLADQGIYDNLNPQKYWR